MIKKILELKENLILINDLIEKLDQDQKDSITEIKQHFNRFEEQLIELEVEPKLNSQFNFFKYHLNLTKSELYKKLNWNDDFEKFIKLSMKYFRFRDESILDELKKETENNNLQNNFLDDENEDFRHFSDWSIGLKTEALKSYAQNMDLILKNFSNNCAKKIMNPIEALNNFKALNESKNEINEFIQFCFNELETETKDLKIIEKDKIYVCDFKKKVIECYNLYLEIFFSFILNFNDKDLDYIFFKSNSKTINQNFREYSFLFHSDRSSLFVTEENLKNFNILFSLIVMRRNKNNELTNSQQNLDRLLFEANSYFEISLDYYNYASNSETKLAKISNADLEKISEEEVLTLFKENFEYSIEKFKLANNVADNLKNYYQMLDIRIRIAECLFKFKSDNIDLKLAVLRPIYLMEKYPNIYDSEEFSQLKKNAEDLRKQVNRIDQIFKKNSKKEADVCLGTLSKINDANINRKAIALTNISITALSLGSLGARAYPLFVNGGLAISLAKPSSAASGFILPVAGIALSIAFFFYQKENYRELSEQSSNFLKEQEIRYKMNTILQQSIELYQKHDFENFLSKLSESFNDKKESLIKVDYEAKIINLSPSNLIELMHKHGFRPDSIAYILYILSDSLMYILFDSCMISKFIKCFKIEKSYLITAIDNLLKSICDELNTNKINLEKEAETLDKNARSLNARIILEDSLWGRFIKNNYYRAKEYFFSKGIINDDVLKEFDKISFKNRLNQIRNSAKFSRLVYSIGFNSKELSIVYVNDYKYLIRDEKFLLENRYISDFRYFLVMDFINILDDSEAEVNVAKEKEDENLTNNLPGNVNDLKTLVDEAKKSENYAQENKFYPLKSINSILSMEKNFKKARNHKNYKDRQLEIDIGYMRSLLKLSKFKQLKNFMNSQVSNQPLIQNYEFWLLGAQAFRKTKNLKKAQELLNQSKTFDSNNLNIRNESQVIDNLTKISTPEYIENLRKKTTIKIENDFHTRIHMNEIKYNILSIDGGGLKGIIPLVWLCEIESRLHRPISHLFNMIAGTSTGSLIASALSIPLEQSTGCLEPFYNANNVLDHYLTKGKDIFIKKDWFNFGITSLFNSKYSNENLSKFLADFKISNFKLNETISDLVIPAVEYKTKYPFIFSSFDARSDVSKNFTLYDAVMSSTAAPTYFDRHNISGFGEYEDGGVSMNDPSDFALEEVLNNRKKDHRDIFLLSLGTSSNVSELDYGSGTYHFLKNFKNYLFNTQDGSTEFKVINKIGSKYSNYQRWQVFTEKEISFDDYNENNLNNLVEYSRQYIEELYISDENYFNKLLARLETNNQIF
ncbi:unnamed protein product [Brachionus calyciflorus]|uniref:PNPLA domain-containing protein n=1 Tax=Brachionus calyciflorus TaxID=104777 RepID=A0A814KRC7_9BILA|nr:unnamed protein product [Brachionus calyciflorus]